MQVRKQQLELDMEQQTASESGNGARQGCILSPSLFNLYAGYIMRNAALDEAQAGIKTAGIGNSCTPVADSCQCMTKSIQYCKEKKIKLKIK